MHHALAAIHIHMRREDASSCAAPPEQAPTAPQKNSKNEKKKKSFYIAHFVSLSHEQVGPDYLIGDETVYPSYLEMEVVRPPTHPYAASSAPVCTRVAATSSYLQQCLSEGLLVSITAAPPILCAGWCVGWGGMEHLCAQSPGISILHS